METPQRAIRWARLAADCFTAQRTLIEQLPDPATAINTVYSESAAESLCAELEHDGLPIDVAVAESLIAEFIGPRPNDAVDAPTLAARRDEIVLRHIPADQRLDLRNPANVKALLRRVGIEVSDTRAWRLEELRDQHPLVDDLLSWRKAERVSTTFGYTWLDANVGADGRLRGEWSASDGAAGRMTATAGLHNMPADLRPAIVAEPGFVFVRADLGQIEPRVLAVVSGDAAFAAATRADDLYAPVAQRLGVDRPVAKVAVLAAMYGQRSGAAGEALKGLERAYPVAMDLLERAAASGRRGEPLRTYGGRLVPTGRFLATSPVGADPALDAARGRFARNAIIQGAAAELFKAWAATVRATTRDLGAQVVLCLHDELLVHAPAEHATEVAARVDRALDDASRRWAGGAPVRFVADTSVIARWSDAKG
jgi:DNA polymerase-1